MTLGCGKRKDSVTMNSDGEHTRPPAIQLVEKSDRTREAVECMKRALIGADPQDTNILTKIANMFNSEEDYPEAAAYHRRIVEVSRAAGSCPFRRTPRLS